MRFVGTSVVAASLLAVIEAAPTTTATAALPIVDLGYALYQATENSTGAYYNFSNIAFAEPPLGDLRFSAPIPPQTTNRTVNDGQTNRICPQASPAWELIIAEYLLGVNTSVLLAAQAATGNLSLADLPTPGPTESEDCLYLDVIVPEAIYNAASTNTSNSTATNSTGAPVLVWIYGGGYTGGNKAGNDPAGLIASGQKDGSEGFVYVAINYRLGMFGWLSGPTFQENGTANAALYDQRLALEWIQDNIHLFGGDANRVTVIGESAGGGSIMHQLTAYGGLKGKVPFQQAILQSPAFFNVGSPNQEETTFDNTLLYASYVSNQSITTLAQLRELPTSVLQTTNAAAVALALFGQFTYGPSVDGLFVPALPGQLLAHGQFDDSVELMVGHNSAEAVFFTSPFVNDTTSFNTLVKSSLPSASDAVLTYIETVLYPPIFNGSYPYTNELARARLVTAESSFTCTTRYLAKAYNNETYSYYFAIPPGLHGEDIDYTFFNGDTSTSDDGLPVQAPVAQRLQGYISSFVKTGDPNFAGAPTFPQYGSDSTVLTFDLANNGTLGVDTVANPRCDWWQKALYY